MYLNHSQLISEDFGDNTSSPTNKLSSDDLHLDDRVAEIAAFIDGPALRTAGAGPSNLTFDCDGASLNQEINTNYHF